MLILALFDPFLKKKFCDFPLRGGAKYPADFPAALFHISYWYLSWNTAGSGDCI